MECSDFFADWHLPQMPQAVLCAMPANSVETSQEAIQSWLDGISSQAGLDAVLASLFAWELRSGYWPEGIFNANLLLTFAPEAGSPVEFRTQINYSRLNYQAPPVKPRAAGHKPFCPICFEDNVGSEAKPLLRVFECVLGREIPTDYFVQATPFPLVRGHFIVIQKAHEPMRIGRRALDELLDFVAKAPTFTACSNSDVLNAGVSILGHHHYQVFARRWVLPVMQALPLDGCVAPLTGGVVRGDMPDYPLTAIRLTASGNDRAALLDTAAGIVERWKAADPGRNTCNLAVRMTDDQRFEVFLFLRNPDHLTPPDLLRIKSEGVGVVEAAGEGIYPPPKDDVGLEEIRRDGRTVITRILKGLNPVEPEKRIEVFRSLTAGL